MRAAEARGVAVVTQVAGTVDGLPDAARAEVVQAVSQALDGVADGRVLLTLTGDAAAGSAFVTFTESPTTQLSSTESPNTSCARSAGCPAAGAVLPAGAPAVGWVEVDEEHDDGDVIVEVRWHKPR